MLLFVSIRLSQPLAASSTVSGAYGYFYGHLHDCWLGRGPRLPGRTLSWALAIRFHRWGTALRGPAAMVAALGCHNSQLRPDSRPSCVRRSACAIRKPFTTSPGTLVPRRVSGSLELLFHRGWVQVGRSTEVDLNSRSSYQREEK